MEKLTQKVSIVTLCLIMIVLSAVPAFAEDSNYVENHNYVDCSNYYLQDMAYYKFLIKVPNGTSLDCVTIYDIYGGRYTNLGNIPLGNQTIKLEYSNQEGDFYMYQFYLVPGLPSHYWQHYGIKVYYDNGSDHYMATNAANGSTTEGSGYILKRY